tara:strand:+ start:1358 stop:3028 length:1671 start_codon:yes stop_codon:yes gene_type:complete
MPESPDPKFHFAISLSVLNHLGRNLYRNFITVLGEAISNAWDADATNVWIDIDKKSGAFSIKDDGVGMDADDFQNKLLKIGYSKRAEGATKTKRDRPYIGAKGIGKLALLSCAERISIISKKEGSDYVGGVIDNSGLDKAITSDLNPEDYPLESLNWDLFGGLTADHVHGTIISFENMKERIRHSEAYIRKMLALSFKFSLIDEHFSIYVNGREVSLEDIRDVLDTTEFLWVVNDGDEEFTRALNKLKGDPVKMVAEFDIRGFVASVEKPRNLKITGTDERATIDLFVNGRLREKNILRHVPTQRLIENYIYGQIHFDLMDVGAKSDPFTSSREGIVEGNEKFQKLLTYLKETALPQIMDEWDKFRLERDKDGDEDNPRKSKRDRSASALYAAARLDYMPDDKSPTKDVVETWLKELRADAEFNLSSYVDCFLSENLVRQYLREHKIGLHKSAPPEIKKWQDNEIQRKAEANISFDIRKDNDGLSYLGMDELALSAEGSKSTGGVQSLWTDAVSYRPVRNVVGHTGLLTANAKGHLSLKFENIRARVKALISTKPA